jgi:pyrroline-5-carboxylate reductase
MPLSISFIGGGNMARSLIGGLIARGHAASSIVVADPAASQLELLKTTYGVHTVPTNAEAAQRGDVVILAVKPQELHNVARDIADAVRDKLLISVAAGIRASDIERWSGGASIVRCMPNRPALQGCGMTGLFAPAKVSAEHRKIAEDILGAVGATLWLTEEHQMDAVTAMSGSGPAYFFLLVEMMEDAGVTLGLPRDIARKLAVETAYGSGLMARQGPETPAMLREQVTSKGGTTEAALKHLETHNVRKLFQQAIAAACERSAQLANELGKD